MRQIVGKTAQTRDDVTAELRAMGIPVPESHTNFVLLPFEHAAHAQRLNSSLRDNGVLLRPMGGHDLPQCLRATIGTPAQMARMLDIVKKEMA